MPNTKITTLGDALMVKLRALYDIESELVKALPKMAKKSTDSALMEAFESHLDETKMHVDRLEQSFKLLDMKASKLKTEGIRGIIADAEWAIKEKPGKEALDSMLIAAASYAEHYEIAGYTAAVKWARMLGNDDVANLLEETLKEEEMADDTLQTLAGEGIDDRAMAMIGEDGDGMSEDEEEATDDEE